MTAARGNLRDVSDMQNSIRCPATTDTRQNIFKYLIKWQHYDKYLILQHRPIFFLTCNRCNRIFVKIVFLFYKEKLSTFTCQNTRDVILTLKYLYHMIGNNNLVLI